MTSEKNLKIKKEKIDVNYKLYFFLKELVAGGFPTKLNENLIKVGFQYGALNWNEIGKIINNFCDELNPSKQKNKLMYVIQFIESELDLRSFLFSLKLIQIKEILLSQIKVGKNEFNSEYAKYHPLSVKHDNLGKQGVYYSRVNGALLSLLFFEVIEKGDINLLSELGEEYISSLILENKYLNSHGVEPNQIFMLMFTESVNQSIKSDAGNTYEDKIYNLLISQGLHRNEIKKIHDEKDKSTEYDFFFTKDGVTIGIGAKRTLRERYKQFIKTSYSSDIDVMVEITLGIDLTEEKMKSIRQHNVYLFVADEVYNENSYMQKMNGVYPGSKFSIKLLTSLK